MGATSPYLWFPRHTTYSRARAIDEIDTSSQIVIRGKSLQSSADHPCVPDPPQHGMVRMDMDVSFVFQACPADHPLLLQSKIDYPPDERILLFLVKQTVDAHVSYVPLSVINFFTRQFLHSLLTNFLSVGVQVRDGDRPEHQEAIQSKPELYQWVQDRANVMFEKLEEEEKRRQRQ